MSNALYIDGKLVTVTNAWRVVKARRPNAGVHREHSYGWPRTSYSVVSDRTGDVPWCYATGLTAGDAWLKVARQMVEWDARVAMEKQEIESAVAALTSAKTSSELEAAALRYAAVRVEQSKMHDRNRLAGALRDMSRSDLFAFTITTSKR